MQDIYTLQSLLKDRESRVAELEEKITEFDNALAKQKQHVEELEARFANVPDINGLKSRLEDRESRVAILEGELKCICAGVPDKFSGNQEKNDKSNERIRELEEGADNLRSEVDRIMDQLVASVAMVCKVHSVVRINMAMGPAESSLQHQTIRLELFPIQITS